MNDSYKHCACVNYSCHSWIGSKRDDILVNKLVKVSKISVRLNFIHKPCLFCQNTKMSSEGV